MLLVLELHKVNHPPNLGEASVKPTPPHVPQILGGKLPIPHLEHPNVETSKSSPRINAALAAPRKTKSRQNGQFTIEYADGQGAWAQVPQQWKDHLPSTAESVQDGRDQSGELCVFVWRNGYVCAEEGEGYSGAGTKVGILLILGVSMERMDMR